MIDGSRHHEKQIGQPIDVSQQNRIDRRLQSNHSSLGTTAHRAREVQGCAGLDPAGEDEALQRRELGFEAIDELLEPIDIGISKHRFGDPGRDLFGRIRQLRAERKKVALNLHERIADDVDDAGNAGAFQSRVREAKPRVQLVDLAVRIDTGVAFEDARTAEERRFTGVTGARIDFHDSREQVFAGQANPTEDLSPL